MTYFVVTSKLGVKITVTEDYWRKIIEIKHPSMAGREKERQTKSRRENKFGKDKNIL
jgi:hypothetical protein